jgi:acetyltransferase-like isoleucine patch superfamily enzyme
MLNREGEHREPKIPMSQVATAQVSVGHYTYGNPLCMVWSPEEYIKIGSFCSIAERVVIFGGGEHRTDWLSTYPFADVFGLNDERLKGHPSSKGTTIIEDDVWLGFQSTILSGVKVGAGAVVGANALVSKDVPPYAIVAGNPAKIIRFRFEECIIKEMLEIAWWNWPIELILQNADKLCTPDAKGAVGELWRVKNKLQG